MWGQNEGRMVIGIFALLEIVLQVGISHTITLSNKDLLRVK